MSSKKPGSSLVYAGGQRRIARIPLADVIDPPAQLIARKFLGDVSHLSEDIRTRGQIQNLLVRPAAEPGKYELLSGWRRRAAMRKAGITEANAVIAEDLADDRDALAAVYAENSEENRSTLGPLDQARVFESMLQSVKGDKSVKDPHAATARLLGTSSENIRRTIRLLSLPEKVQRDLAEGRINKELALTFLKTSPQVQDELAREIGGEGGIRNAPALMRRAKEVGEKLLKKGRASQPKDRRKVVAPRVVWLGFRDMTRLYETLLRQYGAWSGELKDKSLGGPNEGRAKVRKYQLAVFFALRGMQPKIESSSPEFAANLAAEIERLKAGDAGGDAGRPARAVVESIGRGDKAKTKRRKQAA